MSTFKNKVIKMDAAQFLKDHESEAFKKIAEAVYKDCTVSLQLSDLQSGIDVVMHAGKWECSVIFRPVTDAEQWITCLFYYRARVQACKGGEGIEKWAMIAATESREALLIAILEFIEGE